MLNARDDLIPVGLGHQRIAPVVNARHPVHDVAHRPFGIGLETLDVDGFEIVFRRQDRLVARDLVAREPVVKRERHDVREHLTVEVVGAVAAVFVGGGKRTGLPQGDLTPELLRCSLVHPVVQRPVDAGDIVLVEHHARMLTLRGVDVEVVIGLPFSEVGPNGRARAAEIGIREVREFRLDLIDLGLIIGKGGGLGRRFAADRADELRFPVRVGGRRGHVPSGGDVFVIVGHRDRKLFFRLAIRTGAEQRSGLIAGRRVDHFPVVPDMPVGFFGLGLAANRTGKHDLSFGLFFGCGVAAPLFDDASLVPDVVVFRYCGRLRGRCRRVGLVFPAARKRTGRERNDDKSKAKEHQRERFSHSFLPNSQWLFARLFPSTL